MAKKSVAILLKKLAYKFGLSSGSAARIVVTLASSAKPSRVEFASYNATFLRDRIASHAHNVVCEPKSPQRFSVRVVDTYRAALRFRVVVTLMAKSVGPWLKYLLKLAVKKSSRKTLSFAPPNAPT